MAVLRVCASISASKAGWGFTVPSCWGQDTHDLNGDRMTNMHMEGAVIPWNCET